MPGDQDYRSPERHILKGSEEALRSLLDRRLSGALVHGIREEHDIRDEMEAIYFYRKRLLFTWLTGALRKAGRALDTRERLG